MGVTVRGKKKGEWWVFIIHQGKRRSKKIGRDKRLALEVAKKIEAKLALLSTRNSLNIVSSQPFFKPSLPFGLSPDLLNKFGEKSSQAFPLALFCP